MGKDLILCATDVVGNCYIVCSSQYKFFSILTLYLVMITGASLLLTERAVDTFTVPVRLTEQDHC